MLIAKTYLIPKQVKSNGIEMEHLTFNDTALYKVIDSYTREAGVRQLERNISAITRWVAVKYSESNPEEFKPVIITDECVETVLGVPIYDNDFQNTINSPGVAIGLAWT